MVKEFGIWKTIVYFFITFMLLAGVCYADTVTNSPFYKTTVEVVDVEARKEAETTVTIRTKTYQEYQFYGTGFHKGDTVIITFDTKEDNDCTNDEIVDAVIKRR